MVDDVDGILNKYHRRAICEGPEPRAWLRNRGRHRGGTRGTIWRLRLTQRLRIDGLNGGVARRHPLAYALAEVGLGYKSIHRPQDLHAPTATSQYCARKF